MIAYVVTGGKLQVNFSWHAFIPNFTKLNTLVVFVSFILAYMGVEASASHINELKKKLSVSDVHFSHISYLP